MFLGIEGAEINVLDRNHPVKSAKDGDYWRLLVPGKYKVKVSKRGYFPVTKNIQVNDGLATKEDFILQLIGKMHLKQDEGSTNLQEVLLEKKPVPVGLVIGLTLVCLIALSLTLALTIMLVSKYRNRGADRKAQYAAVHTEP